MFSTNFCNLNIILASKFLDVFPEFRFGIQISGFKRFTSHSIFFSHDFISFYFQTKLYQI